MTNRLLWRVTHANVVKGRGGPGGRRRFSGSGRCGRRKPGKSVRSALRQQPEPNGRIGYYLLRAAALNDDLVKSSSVVDDYASRILREDPAGGVQAYVLELIPKPDASVVWGKILYWVRKGDFIPLKQEFYDERGTLVRVMTFSEIRPMGGRTIPTRWEIRPAERPGNSTAIRIKSAVYDRPIDPEIFTQRNLQKP